MFILFVIGLVTVADAFPPTNASWTRVATNPVLPPTESWEGPCTCENVATYDPSFPNAPWRMWYRGGWGTQGVGFASSVDGVTWTKYSGNPIYGYPNDGGQPWVHKDPAAGGGYRLYTTNNNKPPRVNIATSVDGIAWTTSNRSVVALPVNGTLWGNRVVWQEGVTDWRMLQEVMYEGPWQIFYYTSSDGFVWTIGHGGLPLSSLSVGGMYGGPRFASVNGVVTPRHGGVYHLWYHATNITGAGLPTDVYHATSPDLLTWTVTPRTPVLWHLGEGFEHDQCAGPVPVEGAHGVSPRKVSYLYYDGDNNVVGSCAIGLAISD